MGATLFRSGKVPGGERWLGWDGQECGTRLHMSARQVCFGI